MPFTKTCPVCHEIFATKEKRQKYCSRDCFHVIRSNKLRTNAKTATSTCPICKQSIWDPKHPDRIYCSRECMGIAKRKRISKKCKGCGKRFDVPVSLSHLSHCSKECQRNRQVNRCIKCGKSYSVRATRSESSKYCSTACYTLDWVNNLRKRIGKAGPTSIEQKTQNALYELRVNFEPEKRFSTYLVDFFLPDLLICLEIDGDYWHSLPNVAARDARKDKYLIRKGYRVIRISETDINAAECVTTLIAHRLGLD